MEKSLNAPNWAKVAEVELVYKSKVKASERPAIKTSKDAYAVLTQVWDENTIELQEQFKVLLLNASCKVLGVYHVSSGSITSTLTDPRLIFSATLKAGAVSIIMAHNHPSGVLTPSDPDLKITAQLKSAGLLLDIKVLDHIIISAEGYYSFADEGLL